MIQIGVDSGGWRAGKVISPLHVAFNRVLRVNSAGIYSPEIDRYGIVWRVSGDVEDFAFEGLDALRRNKAKRLITADIGIRESRWQTMSQPELAAYLVKQVRLALEAFVERLKQDGEEVDGEKMLSDYERAAAAFLESMNS